MTKHEKAQQMFMWRDRGRWRDDNDVLVEVVHTMAGTTQLYYFRKLFTGELISPVVSGILYPAIVSYLHSGDVEASYYKDGERLTLPVGWDDMDEETKVFTYEMM